MIQTKITLWEKFKRIIAHAFELETRLEVEQRIERAKFEEEQRSLRLQHHQHIRSLMIEYADEIEQFQRDKEAQEQAAILEAERKARVELHKSNKGWDRHLITTKKHSTDVIDVEAIEITSEDN